MNESGSTPSSRKWSRAAATSVSDTGSLIGPVVRGAKAGLPTIEPRKTTLTQSRSVKTYARNSSYPTPSSPWLPVNVRAGVRRCASGCAAELVTSENAAASLIGPLEIGGFAEV